MPSAGVADVTDCRQQTEERIVEIRHRLVAEAECVELGRSPGFLDVEEELLDELRELELVLAAEDTGNRGRHAMRLIKSQETAV